MMAAASNLELSATVFGDENETVLVLQGDTIAASSAIARGLPYCGLIHVSNGEPRVECEPGARAVAAMLRAGPDFAAILGEKLKQQRG